MKRLLLVDDELNVLKALKRCLMLGEIQENASSFEVETYTDPFEALARSRDIGFDMVISDFRMPAMDGVTFLKQFRELQPDAMRIILSGQADLEGVIAAINEAGIFRFVTKPWQDFELRFVVQQALAYRELQMENTRLADLVRIQQGKLSRQEAELRRLEQESPGITQVRRTSDGYIVLDELDDDLEKF